MVSQLLGLQADGFAKRLTIRRPLLPDGVDLLFLRDMRVASTMRLAREEGVELTVIDTQGKPLPGLAPVAKQQGQYVARAIVRKLRGRPAPPPSSYRDYGTLETIGRGKAVAEFGRIHLTGGVAWVTWAVAHIFFLIGFRNRVLVSTQWAFAYATRERGDRLIVERLDGSANIRDRPPTSKE